MEASLYITDLITYILTSVRRAQHQHIISSLAGWSVMLSSFTSHAPIGALVIWVNLYIMEAVNIKVELALTPHFYVKVDLNKNWNFLQKGKTQYLFNTLYLMGVKLPYESPCPLVIISSCTSYRSSYFSLLLLLLSTEPLSRWFQSRWWIPDISLELLNNTKVIGSETNLLARLSVRRSVGWWVGQS